MDEVVSHDKVSGAVPTSAGREKIVRCWLEASTRGDMLFAHLDQCRDTSPPLARTAHYSVPILRFVVRQPIQNTGVRLELQKDGLPLEEDRCKS